jgi:hypothetical protein
MYKEIIKDGAANAPLLFLLAKLDQCRFADPLDSPNAGEIVFCSY